jgi:lysyl endopeptidase
MATSRRQLSWSRALWCAAAAGLLPLGAGAQPARAPRAVGENRPWQAETPHPYGAVPGRGGRPAMAWSDEVHAAGARFVRVHFAEFDLAEGDLVTVSDPKRSLSWTYTGRGPAQSGEFWSFAVPGDTALVELQARGGGGHGYRIDAYAHGTEDVYAPEPEVAPESICGTDGKRDAACFPAINSRPVARLLFSTGTGQALCTGTLVRGSNPNTLITNNHCLSTQAGVSSLQAMFNFQRTACGGAANAATSSFTGDRFLSTSPVNGGLDYTLLTLQGNPVAAFGEAAAAAANAPVGREVYLIQHPGGRVKQVSRFEDSAQTVPCRIQTASGTQTSYNCDTEGGSSGSGVFDAATNQMVALHHFGSCPHNSATMIRQICDHAGALLACGAVPGANLALNRPATGSAACNANEGPAQAVNGSVSGGNSDKFCSTAATRFLTVDLGAARTLGRFVVKHAGAGGESTTWNSRAFSLDVSGDGTTFTRVVTVTANTASVSTHAVAPVAARFVRLNVTMPQQTAGGAARIYELEVYAP